MKGCRNCIVWQALGEHLDREDPATAGKKVEIGLCRRHAPLPVPLQGPEAAGDRLEGRWPRVASDDWCGQWEPKVN